MTTIKLTPRVIGLIRESYFLDHPDEYLELIGADPSDLFVDEDLLEEAKEQGLDAFLKRTQ
jgi:hypothetical protein